MSKEMINWRENNQGRQERGIKMEKYSVRISNKIVRAVRRLLLETPSILHGICMVGTEYDISIYEYLMDEWMDGRMSCYRINC